MPHVLVAGPLHPAGIECLAAAPGITYRHVTSRDPAAYVSHVGDADGLVLRTQPLTAATVAIAPKLRIVSRNGVGYDTVEVEALTERGIPLAVVGDVNTAAVAEHAMMLLLAASRDLVNSANRLRTGDWLHRDEYRSRELDAKTLLIIGFGRIGRQLARYASAFGVRILAFDPWLPSFAFSGAERISDLHVGLESADLVSIHVPGTDRPILDVAAISRLKPGAIIVNTARGNVVDEAALAAALSEGRVGAAGIDVFSTEPPPPDHPLLALDSVIATPHSAGLTAECARRMARAAVQNVLDCLDGRLDPGLVVNPVKA
ncbi:MAG: hydroxyacid dehydrogenase [Paracoccaceae bacterium]|nr:hydroxyacid dehydrogenase [Paracoccaceae bacterium]